MADFRISLTGFADQEITGVNQVFTSNGLPENNISNNFKELNGSWKNGIIINLIKNISINSNSIYCTLPINGIFDGNNFTIDFGSTTNVPGLFVTNGSSLSNGSIIRNLATIGGTTSNIGGFIVREKQRFFTVRNCFSTGEIGGGFSETGGGGGICGQSAGFNGGNCLIEYCYSLGNIGNGAGGIVGSSPAGNQDSSSDAAGICTVQYCYSVGNIGRYGGGITGQSSCYNTINSILTVKNCFAHGHQTGSLSGGIIGGQSRVMGSGAKIFIENCYYTGNIGGEGGGMIGWRVSQGNGQTYITNCYAINPTSGGRGGMVGWLHGPVYINNSFCNGTVIGNGGFFANSNQSTFNGATITSNNNLLTSSLNNIANQLNINNWNSNDWIFPTDNQSDIDIYPRLKAFTELPFNNNYDYYFENPLFLNNDTKPFNFDYTFDNGNFTFIPIGGSGNFSYSSSPSFGSYTWNTNSTITNISGNRYMSIRDDNTQRIITRYIIFPQEKIKLSINKTNVTCMGSTNGSINIQITNYPSNNFNFTWRLNNIVIQSNSNTRSSTRSSLVTGTYSITIENSEIGSITENITIEEPELNIVSTILPSQSINSIDKSFGAINVSFTGKNYTISSYQWSGPNNFSSTQQNISNIKTGNYSLTVTFNNNCTKVFANLFVPLEIISLNKTITQPTCPNTNDAIISLNVTGSTVYNYIYEWNDGFLGKYRDNLTNGIYEVKVKNDKNNILFEESIEIKSDSFNIIPTIKNNTVINIKDNFNENSILNKKNGFIYLDLSNNENIINSYSWTGPNGYTSNDKNIINLDSGLYTVKIIYNTECDIHFSYTVSKEELTFNKTITNINCIGQNTGNIDVNLTPGNYSYLWDNNITSNQLSNLNSGNYKVTIRNTLNELMLEDIIIITEPILNSSSIVKPSILINSIDRATGSILINISDAENIKINSYNWIGPNLFKSSDKDITNCIAGKYTLTINYNNNCVINNIYIIENYVTTSTINNSQNSIMFVKYNGKILLTGDDKNIVNKNNINYEWYFDNKLISKEKYVFASKEGIYNLRVNNEPIGVYSKIIVEIK